MHPPVSAEKKEAMRQLREFLPPTYARLATIGGLHVTTVREIASKENCPRGRSRGAARSFSPLPK